MSQRKKSNLHFLNLKFYLSIFFLRRKNKTVGKFWALKREKKYLEPGLFFLRSPPNSKPKNWAELVFFSARPGTLKKKRKKREALFSRRKKKNPPQHEKKWGPPGKTQKNSNFARQPPTLA